MKTCPNREMSTQAYSVASDSACAPLASTEKLHGSVGVLIVGCELLGVFELIPTVGARLIVSQYGPGGLKLVIDSGTATRYPWPLKAEAIRRIGPVT
jgi:hypothetical protein